MKTSVFKFLAAALAAFAAGCSVEERPEAVSAPVEDHYVALIAEMGLGKAERIEGGYRIGGDMVFSEASLDTMASRRRGLGKSTQTRWDNAAGLDVKHLREAGYVRVYFEPSGSLAVTAAWKTAFQAAMVKWNALASADVSHGSAVSFVETPNSWEADVHVKMTGTTDPSTVA